MVSWPSFRAIGRRDLLLSPRDAGSGCGGEGRRLTKLLVHVAFERSLGPVHVLVPAEGTVAELVEAAVVAYVKEGRRPLLSGTDPTELDLHYDMFSLQCLNPEEKLINLGSRNFFLCSRLTKVIK